MATMVERVAQAIDAEVGRQGEQGERPWSSILHDDGMMTIDGRVDVKAIARAAIEAMREPTEFMERAASQEGNVGHMLDGWTAMIEAALKEEVTNAD